MSDFKIVKLIDPIVVQTNGVNASISGNTDGTPAIISSGTMILAGGNNITLSQSQNTVSIIGGAGAGGGIANAAGTQTANTGTVKFANSNGITFGMSNSSQITASHNGLTSQSNQAVSAGNGSVAFQTLSLADSNGVSFSTGTQGVYATVKTDYQSSGNYLTTARASNDAVGLNTAKTNVTWTVNSSGLSLDAGGYAGTNSTFNGTNISGSITQNSNGLRLDLSINPGGGAGDGYNIIGINGNATSLSTTYTLTDANNVSFGLNAGSITASASYSQSTQPVAASASNGSFNFSTLKFVETNGVTWATSTDGIRASVKTDYLTTAMASNRGTDFVQATAAFNGTNASGTIASNAISVSVAAPVAQTNQTLGLYGSGNTSGTSTGTVDARSLTFNVSGSLTVDMTNGKVNISAPNALTTAMQSNAVTLSNIKVSAGTTSNNLSAMTFADGSGVSWGINASTITASVKTDYQSSNANYLTSQSNQALSGSNGSFTFQTATLGNLNGMSFYTSNGSMVGSYTVPTVTNSSWTVSDAATSATVGRLAFTNSNGLTMSLSTSNNGNHTVIGSYTVPTVTQYFSKTNTTFNGANISGSITNNTDGLNLSLSVAAPGGGVNPAASASNGSFAFTTLNFSNANNVTFGTSAGGIMTASVAAPGAAAENNWFALTGANTAGNTTASGSTIGLSGINLTLSGTNGSGINISAPATSSLSATGNFSISTNGSTISMGVPVGTVASTFVPGGYGYAPGRQFSSSSLGQNSVYLYPMILDKAVTGSIFRIPMFITNSSSAASNGSKAQTIRLGIYTTNATNETVLSIWQSTSYTISASYSSNVSWAQSMITGIGNTTSYNTLTASSAGLNLSASLHGQRDILMPVTASFSSGTYWLAFHHSTTGSGTVGNVLNMSQGVQTWATFNRLGVSTNASASGLLQNFGIGSYSTTTGALPSGISATMINQFGLAPIVYLGNETV